MAGIKHPSQPFRNASPAKPWNLTSVPFVPFFFFLTMLTSTRILELDVANHKVSGAYSREIPYVFQV